MEWEENAIYVKYLMDFDSDILEKETGKCITY